MRTLQIFKRLFTYIVKYRLKLILLTGLALLGAAFEVAKPLPIKLVVDNVLGNHPLPDTLAHIFNNQFFLQSKEQLLGLCIVLMVIITVGNAVMSLMVATFMVN